MADDARRAIDPAMQIALERFAERLRRNQDNLPLWLYELVETYGLECFAQGVKYAHERPTTPASGDGFVEWVEGATPTHEYPWERDK